MLGITAGALLTRPALVTAARAAFDERDQS
jgi:hypothetical protein